MVLIITLAQILQNFEPQSKIIKGTKRVRIISRKIGISQKAILFSSATASFLCVSPIKNNNKDLPIIREVRKKICSPKKYITSNKFSVKEVQRKTFLQSM